MGHVRVAGIPLSLYLRYLMEKRFADSVPQLGYTRADAPRSLDEAHSLLFPSNTLFHLFPHSLSSPSLNLEIISILEIKPQSMGS